MRIGARIGLWALAVAVPGCSGLSPSDKTDSGSPPPTDTDADADTDADSDADADADADSDADSDTDTDPTGAYRHTITIDGNVGDFDAGDESFPIPDGATSIAWDATNLYIGVDHPDLGTDALHWVVITLGNGGAGSTVGAAHNTQVPDLAFEATSVVRWKADDSYNSLLTYNGSGWDETPYWLNTAGSAYGSNFATHQAEVAIPFSAIGGSGTFLVHVNFVYEGAGYESSYAPTPSASFAPGYDPDYTAWYAFDRSGTIVPTAYAVQQGGTTEPIDTSLPTGDTGTVGPTGDTGTGPTGDTGTSDTGAPAPWRFTATVDGDASEWPIETKLPSSSGEWWMGWDETSLYVALRHPDVQGTAQHWAFVYAGNGDGSGSILGIPHNTQQPALPFRADHLVRWKADDSYDSLETWDGVSAWTGTSPLFGTGGAVLAESDANQTVEFSVPLATLGASSTLDLVAGLLFEGDYFESTYAGTPAGAFVEGYDPDLVQYWSFDLSAAAPPASYQPLP